jgi:hypothetical protein
MVALNLRSASVVLSHLRELLVEAHDIGHSHKAIHASLEAAGLRASWNTYKSCLTRMKKATRAISPSPSIASPAAFVLSARSAAPPMHPGAAAADESAALRPDAVPADVTPPQQSTSSATRVLDALRQAREVANSKDYGQIGRDLYRQKQRDERRKDRP